MPVTSSVTLGLLCPSRLLIVRMSTPLLMSTEALGRKAMEAHARQLLRCADAPPVSAQVIRRQKFALNRTKYPCLGSDVAHTERKPQLQVLDLMGCRMAIA